MSALLSATDTSRSSSFAARSSPTVLLVDDDLCGPLPLDLQEGCLGGATPNL